MRRKVRQTKVESAKRRTLEQHHSISKVATRQSHHSESGTFYFTL
jgi:hypothetical protein